MTRRTMLETMLAALGGGIALAQTEPTDADMMRPEALAKLLEKGNGPAILYVGPPVLYRAAHIRGARLIGPTARPEGVEAFKAALSGMKRDAEVVAYCGCCPWGHCPNIRPALQVMREMGFKRGKVLYLPTNTHTDWTSKGYPVERGA